MIQFQKLQPKGDTVVDHTPLPKVAITTECGLTPTWLHLIGQGLSLTTTLLQKRLSDRHRLRRDVPCEK